MALLDAVVVETRGCTSCVTTSAIKKSDDEGARETKMTRMRPLLVLALVVTACGSAPAQATPSSAPSGYVSAVVASGVSTPAIALGSSGTVLVAINTQDANGRDATGAIGALAPGATRVDILPGSSASGTVSALAVSGDGVVYFARTSNTDASANGIFRYAGGAVTRIAGGGTRLVPSGRATDVLLQGVVSLAVLADGAILAAEYGDNRVVRVGRDGTIASVVGTGACDGRLEAPAQTRAADIALCGPGPLATDASGTIYVAARERDWILAVDTAGNARVIAAKLGQLSALAVDSAGGLVAADLSAKRLLRASGGSVTVLAANVPNPRAIAIAANGDIYAADDVGAQIVRLSRVP